MTDDLIRKAAAPGGRAALCSLSGGQVLGKSARFCLGSCPESLDVCLPSEKIGRKPSPV